MKNACLLTQTFTQSNLYYLGNFAVFDNGDTNNNENASEERAHRAVLTVT
jgi:hypothetical protein